MQGVESALPEQAHPVVWLARVVGFRSSKQRPLSGNECLWRAFAKTKAIAWFQQLGRLP